jgi:hypothetical protein
LTIALLTVIALAATLQAVCLVLLLRSGRRLARRLEEVEQELRPRLVRAGEIVEDVALLTDSAARQLPELESAVRQAATGVRRAASVVDLLTVGSFRPLGRALALWRGLRYGAGVYRRSRLSEP